ncbi:MAG: hypothetical protein LBL94_09350 [Prevotellaceae bacterium]|jgi:hypothetical protein|nr:hypothetical protein [Prevotellaceae bacterium]
MENRAWREEQQLKQTIECFNLAESNRWIHLRNGKESAVYIHPEDNRFVRKVFCYKILSKTPSEALQRIQLHNSLFPETAYEIEGYADYFGEFCFVLKQPFIVGKRPSAKEIVEEMRKRGFEDMGGGQLFINDTYIVDDLHEGNVIKSADGFFYFIDTLVLYTS